MIKFENVSMVYEPKQQNAALDEVSIEIDRGEFAFLVGESGSGKSTFLSLVLREKRSTDGSVYVAGQNLNRIPSRRVPKLRRDIGFVFQDFRLLRERTVFDNVAFAMEVIGASRAQIRERVPDALKMVGLEDKARRKPTELSGGEQQRVGIARAIVNRPSILLADEPTGNLDRKNSIEVMNVLNRINQNGTTVLMATHAHELVSEYRHRVIELKRGRVIRDEIDGQYTPMTTVVNQDGSRELLVGDSAVEYDEESQVAEDKKDEDQ
ncbi:MULTISPECIES: cell division ATP-binding protein FtsE [Glutamicibacter]|jgi:cell division transport system ATP-binding protein|uniref:Cell division ATP-binding protein FtsE n=1 Tax=Glutamicibacter mysorens TaxID=257984 RepID=A0ABX4MVD1_9MICC|nr:MULTISPECIES: cell division ATP-binding protein FtsE [Glutamicibacter]KWR73348.1 cell division ATP-binding protein FtsE [Arthrobacter sp. W1]MDV2975621.1 cell division ATP-binding protein FtsE [Actinomycetes bacterium ARC8]PJJ43445.1 cell division ATP-binding protein FtsE [Glutamicibacter mysorens]QEP06832.1 cell division ATP-binding protein FtsE [Glutamicibacter sp. ZJUTW]RWZ83387.1 cell division ATP-binding protein FtsE [Glutamicibacter sp. HZAU]